MNNFFLLYITKVIIQVKFFEGVVYNQCWQRQNNHHRADPNLVHIFIIIDEFVYKSKDFQRLQVLLTFMTLWKDLLDERQTI